MSSDQSKGAAFPSGTGTKAVDRVEYRMTMLVRLLEAFARRRNDPLDRAHYLMLRNLADGDLRIGELSTLLALDATTVTRQVTAMEERGLVKRRIDERDRRSALVQRTEKGAELAAEMQANRVARIARMTRDWDEQEIEAFAAALDRFDAELYRLLRGS